MIGFIKNIFNKNKNYENDKWDKIIKFLMYSYIIISIFSVITFLKINNKLINIKYSYYTPLDVSRPLLVSNIKEVVIYDNKKNIAVSTIYINPHVVKIYRRRIFYNKEINEYTLIIESVKEEK